MPFRLVQIEPLRSPILLPCKGIPHHDSPKTPHDGASGLRGLKPPPGADEDGFGLDASEPPRSVPLANPAEAERMTGRVGVDLEIVRLVVIVRRFEYLRPQRHHFGVRLVEVFHP